jgi:polyvinyl alcohol dehydrogenase (cytochrome)
MRLDLFVSKIVYACLLAIIVCCAISAAAQNSSAPSTGTPSASSGDDVYQKRCARCHDIEGSRAPSKDALQKLSAKRILRTLDFGLMMAVAYPINRADREAVANYLGTKVDEAPLPASAFCAANVGIMAGPARDAWAGWSPDASNSRYQSTVNAGITAGQVKHLKLKWALGFPGDVTAFAAPSVV